MKTYLYRASNLKSTFTFLALVSLLKASLVPVKNCRFLRESGGTLYVGLARTAPPTNTNFRLRVEYHPAHAIKVVVC